MLSSEIKSGQELEEHAAKRIRLENDGSTRDGSLNTRKGPSEEATHQLAQELKFGINAHVSKTPGFACVVKKRFTDFLVNEIQPTGAVVHLEAPTVSKTLNQNGGDSNHQISFDKSDRKNAVYGTNGSHSESKDQPEAVKEQPTATIADSDVSLLRDIFGSSTTDLLISLNEKTLANPNRKSKDHPTHTSDPIDDKQKRTEAHVAVRRIFGGRIDTVTSDDNRIQIKAAARGKKANARRPPGQQDGPRTKGKVGWDELGGEYLHFTLYKENKDTMEVLSYIASQLKMPAKNFQFAGTKDRRGVTVQRVCVYRVTKERLQALNPRLRQARMSSFEYKQHGLELGDLAGNQFTIALRDCRLMDQSSSEVLEQVIQTAAAAFKTYGYLNYYGLQRFGSFNISTAEIGKRILRGDLKGAVDGILSFPAHLLELNDESGDGPKTAIDDIRRAKALNTWTKTHKTGAAVENLPRRFQAENAIIRHLGFVDRGTGKQKQLQDWQGALMQIPRNLRLMYVHAYQSLVWNSAVSRRALVYAFEVVEGDLVLVEKSQAQKEDAKEETDEQGEVIIRPADGDSSAAAEDKFQRARVLTKEEAESGRFTIYDIVLPQPGYDVNYPANQVGDFYKTAMGEDGLDPHDMRRKWRDISLSGSYRKVMAKPEEVSFELVKYTGDDDQLLLTDLDRLEGKTDLGITMDSSLPEKTALVIKMQLGSSQYATMALRELTQGGAVAYKPDYSGR